MESLAVSVLPLPQPSFFHSKPTNRKTGFPSRPCKQRSSHISTRLSCHKMYVPEASPEAKAAKNHHNFFNYTAIKMVSARCTAPGSLPPAVPILEVRSAYCKHDFEWDNFKRLAFKMAVESNTKFMREYVLETSHVTEK